MLNEQTLERILTRLPELKIAVVGDLFLDKYLDLDASLTEPSIETGLDAYQVSRVRCYPGAGGTVLNNLHALGIGELHAVSVIGQDGEGFELLCELDRLRVHSDHVIQTGERMTPTYTKPMLSQPDGPARELNRLDIKNRQPLPAELERQVIAALDELTPRVDAVILADQVELRNCGVITDAVRARLAELAVQYPDKIFFADSRTRIGLFRNCLVKPNRSELLQALGIPAERPHDRAAVISLARRLGERTARPVYTTCGEEGIVYVDRDAVYEVPGIAVTGPIDIVGAGDSTTAGIVSALCAGAAPAEAGALGCLVASITIQQLGVTGTASPAQVRQRFRESAAS
jgi:rfaE bifunctional protein kinase chain/domain